MRPGAGRGSWGGVALSQTFPLSGVVSGCFIALSLCPSLSDRKCPSLPHWSEEPTTCSHFGDSGLKRLTLTWTPAIPNPVAPSTRGMPVPRPNRAAYFLARVRTLACTWGSWKGGPTSPHDPISQHPPLSTGTAPVKGGLWDNTVNLVFQSGGFLRAAPHCHLCQPALGHHR